MRLLLLLAGSAVPRFLLLFNTFCAAALHPGEEVVLGDKVAGAGMERAGEEGAEEEIEYWLEGTTAELGEGIVEGELGDEVQ